MKAGPPDESFCRNRQVHYLAAFSLNVHLQKVEKRRCTAKRRTVDRLCIGLIRVQWLFIHSSYVEGVLHHRSIGESIIDVESATRSEHRIATTRLAPSSIPGFACSCGCISYARSKISSQSSKARAEVSSPTTKSPEAEHSIIAIELRTSDPI